MDGMFLHSITIYNWFYLVPSFVILGGEMFCNDTEKLEQTLCKVNLGRYTAIAIMCAVLVLLVAVSVFLSQIYASKCWINKLDYMASNDFNFQTKFFFYVIVVVLSEQVPYKRYDYTVYKVRCTVNAILSFVIYFDLARQFTFKKPEIQRLFLAFQGVVFAFDFAVALPQYFTSETHYFPLWFLIMGWISLVVSKNLVPIIFARKIAFDDKLRTPDYKYLLSMYPTEAFMKIVPNDYSPEAVSSTEDKDKQTLVKDSVTRQNMESFENFSKESLEYKIKARGMVVNHVSNCKNVSCFCKADYVYNPIKKKNVFFSKSEVKNSSFFSKYFIKNVIYLNKPNPPYGTTDWNIDYAEFCFKNFHDIFLANFHLRQAEFN